MLIFCIAPMCHQEHKIRGVVNKIVALLLQKQLGLGLKQRQK